MFTSARFQGSFRGRFAWRVRVLRSECGDGVVPGSFRGRLVVSGSFRGRFGVVLGVVSGSFRRVSSSLFQPFGPTLAPCFEVKEAVGAAYASSSASDALAPSQSRCCGAGGGAQAAAGAALAKQ
eukprot:6186296-Pleurochrysis_carterae.AAC.1